jgi:2-methylisocitrate lyase-like PEP mutase family enzyme
MPTRATLLRKAKYFRSLHHGPALLVLANAWDAASARLFEQAGFAAIGTTSAGIAWSQGCPDGQRLSREAMVEAVGRIAAAVSVPVTADMESGYGETAEEIAETVRLTIRAGAAGINLEDSRKEAPGLLWEASAHAENIRAARAAARAENFPLVINARTDVYWEQAGAPESRLDQTIRRATTYLEAGADCIFVPGVRDAETIGRLAGAIPGPLNLLAGPGMPPVPELRQLGVRRLSVGSGPMRAALTLLEGLARELLDSGTCSAFTEGVLPYAEVNRRFGGGD